MPRNVILTESQIILLFEAMSLKDIHEKYYKTIPIEVFSKIIQSDPTFDSRKPNKMGKYGKWLISLYSKGDLKIEDLYKATEYLTTFIKFYNRIEDKDINHYKNLSELYDAIKAFNENSSTSHADEIRKIKEGAEKVYEDDTWLVVVPNTMEASIYYGKHTQWCTAAESSYNAFDYYNDLGPLFININKKTNKKYQFHFETKSMMDENDSEIDSPLSNTIGFTHGLLNFYKKYLYNEGLIIQYLSLIYNINKNNEEDFKRFNQNNGFIIVQNENGLYNLINKNNEFLFKQWANEASVLIDNNLVSFKFGNLTNVFIKNENEFLFDDFIDLKGYRLFDIKKIFNVNDIFILTLYLESNRERFESLIDYDGTLHEATLGAHEFYNFREGKCVMRKIRDFYLYDYEKKEICSRKFEYFSSFYGLMDECFMFTNGDTTIYTDDKYHPFFQGKNCKVERCKNSKLAIFQNEDGYFIYKIDYKDFINDEPFKEAKIIELWDEKRTLTEYGDALTEPVLLLVNNNDDIMLMNKLGRIFCDDIKDIEQKITNKRDFTYPYALNITLNNGYNFTLNQERILSTYIKKNIRI